MRRKRRKEKRNAWEGSGGENEGKIANRKEKVIITLAACEMGCNVKGNRSLLRLMEGL